MEVMDVCVALHQLSSVCGFAYVFGKNAAQFRLSMFLHVKHTVNFLLALLSLSVYPSYFFFVDQAR